MVVAVLPQMPVAYIDIRFFVHATENLDKVVEAVQRLLPSDYIDDILFKKGNLKGHYGNPITLFETRIKNREVIKAFVENLASTADPIHIRIRVRKTKIEDIVKTCRELGMLT
ncbi:MAG: hypothetical protein AOA66_1233 [Candidatus Bathyarchaeota archaeon BA2]|nr:MAG: hypothetical protein AOA66_1233 [Candidatus Bathyarchaeota archaeon BA2]